MTCFGSQEELLYLFEILIQDLELTQDKIHESGGAPLLLKIKFLSLPIFTITQMDFDPTNLIFNAEHKTGKISYLTGKSCLFSKKPQDLVKEMQKTPLKIGIFCLKDTYPIAEVTLPFTGCVCDQITMATNDFDHLPKPYVLQGTFGLLDPGGNPSGNLNLVIKIGCQGKYVTTHYQMEENSFVFKNDREEGRYLVQRVIPPSQTTEEKQKADSGISEIHIEPTESPEEENPRRRSSKKHNKKKKDKLIQRKR
ncbi:uncharacterized protein [Chelonus insularis]|uniref:uncharacterized protein n=1 Tax=Chelonus insularis TaxID=460826 RepID=UPI001588DE2C|nr:uncharacterized protein LOC118064501 [Chelonus insularis]